MAQYDVSADVAALIARGVTLTEINERAKVEFTELESSQVVWNRREQAIFIKAVDAITAELDERDEAAAAEQVEAEPAAVETETVGVRSAAAPSTGATAGDLIKVPAFINYRDGGATIIDADEAARLGLSATGSTWARVATTSGPNEYVRVIALDETETAAIEAEHRAAEAAAHEQKQTLTANVRDLLAPLDHDQVAAVAVALGLTPVGAAGKIRGRVTSGVITLAQVEAAVAEVTA